MNKTTKLLSMAAIASLVFTACSKNDTDENPDQLKAVELTAANAVSEYAYNDAYVQVMSANSDNDLMGRGDDQSGDYSRCGSVTVVPADPGVFPKTVTVDFGAACQSPGGITREGKIIYTISDRFYNTGANISASFDGYKVNGIAVAGTYTITNNGSGNGNGLAISTSVTGGSITLLTGTVYNYSGNKTITQTAGTGTFDIADDEFSISGSSNASNSNGQSLSSTITSNLIVKNSCRNVVQGISAFTYNNISGTINYGNGNCDNKAIIQIGNWTTEVTLP